MRIFILSDCATPSGFGRIADEVGRRLAARGHQIVGSGLQYDGSQPTGLPYHVIPLVGKDLWNYLNGVVPAYAPDIVWVCQDFPYAWTLYNGCRIDWSRIAILNTTPIDGTPIAQDWLDTCDNVDGTMTISRFGVEALRKAGKRATLCHPGVDLGFFKPASEPEKKALREKAGIAPDAFVVGMMAMNQGRKNIPATLEAFKEFALDKPTARLLMDMEKVSPAGWNIPTLSKEIGLRPEQILYREDMNKAGVTSLRDRICLLDVQSVISHREGFGLPLLESQACGVVAMALDWCSGTEICGDGKGVLIPCDTHPRYGTWGNAQDKDPDMDAFIAALHKVHDEPGYRAHIAEAGYKWAMQQTWDNAANAVDMALTEALAQHKKTWPEVEKEIHAASLNHHPGVQPTAAPDEVHRVPDRHGEPEASGGDSGGRLQPGLQPDGTHGAALHGYTQPVEPGIRGDVQRGSEGGAIAAAVLPELGHNRPAELVRANGDVLQ